MGSTPSSKLFSGTLQLMTQELENKRDESGFIARLIRGTDFFHRETKGPS